MKYTTCFEWTINNFTTVASPDGLNSAIISKDFSISGTTATAYLAFCHTNPFCNDKCSLFLQVRNVENATIKETTVKLSINNKEDKRIGKRKTLTRLNLLNSLNFIGFASVVPKTKLYPPDSSFIKDDMINIRCKISCTIGENALVQVDKISSNEVFEGCIIRSDQKEFCASKRLLSSRSTFFESFLTLENEDARSGRIRLPTVDHEVFYELKHFIFFGRSSDNWPLKSIESLYAIACKCLFYYLKSECKWRLLDTKDETELIICLKMGFCYNDNELKVHSLTNLQTRFFPKSELFYFETIEWMKFAARELKLALQIKIEAYKAVGILSKDYDLQ